MKAVLPGKPEASLQALSTGYWNGNRVVVYISGSALTILSDPETILQTIYDDDERKLEAVAFDEFSGKIAACTGSTIRIYKPFDGEQRVNLQPLEWKSCCDLGAHQLYIVGTTVLLRNRRCRHAGDPLLGKLRRAPRRPRLVVALRYHFKSALVPF
jgi:hypothetical protein